MTVTETTLDSIKDELVSGIRSANRHRTRRRMAAVIPAVGLLAGAALVMANDDPEPAYAMTQQPDGSIRVVVYPDFDDVDALQRDLENAGLEVSVVQLNAHPSLEGVVEVASHSNEATGAVEFQDGDFVIDVAEVRGDIEILIYSRTEPGDDYQASPSVFAPGQPLAGLNCAVADQPLETATFEMLAGQNGLPAAVWTTFGEVDNTTGAVDFEESATRPDGAVLGAQLRNPEAMDVFVDPNGTATASSSIAMADGTHYRAAPACTPELAAAWD